MENLITQFIDLSKRILENIDTLPNEQIILQLNKLLSLISNLDNDLLRIIEETSQEKLEKDPSSWLWFQGWVRALEKIPDPDFEYNHIPSIFQSLYFFRERLLSKDFGDFQIDRNIFEYLKRGLEYCLNIMDLVIKEFEIDEIIPNYINNIAVNDDILEGRESFSYFNENYLGENYVRLLFEYLCNDPKLFKLRVERLVNINEEIEDFGEYIDFPKRSFIRTMQSFRSSEVPKGLEIDGWNKKYNILFEYDGFHHFKEIYKGENIIEKVADYFTKNIWASNHKNKITNEADPLILIRILAPKEGFDYETVLTNELIVDSLKLSLENNFSYFNIPENLRSEIDKLDLDDFEFRKNEIIWKKYQDLLIPLPYIKNIGSFSEILVFLLTSLKEHVLFDNFKLPERLNSLIKKYSVAKINQKFENEIGSDNLKKVVGFIINHNIFERILSIFKKYRVTYFKVSDDILSEELKLSYSTISSLLTSMVEINLLKNEKITYGGNFGEGFTPYEIIYFLPTATVFIEDVLVVENGNIVNNDIYFAKTSKLIIDEYKKRANSYFDSSSEILRNLLNLEYRESLASILNRLVDEKYLERSLIKNKDAKKFIYYLPESDVYIDRIKVIDNGIQIVNNIFYEKRFLKMKPIFEKYQDYKKIKYEINNIFNFSERNFNKVFDKMVNEEYFLKTSITPKDGGQLTIYYLPESTIQYENKTIIEDGRILLKKLSYKNVVISNKFKQYMKSFLLLNNIKNLDFDTIIIKFKDYQNKSIEPINHGIKFRKKFKTWILKNSKKELEHDLKILISDNFIGDLVDYLQNFANFNQTQIISNFKLIGLKIGRRTIITLNNKIKNLNTKIE